MARRLINPFGMTPLDYARIEIEATVSRTSVPRAYSDDPRKRRVGLYTYVRIAKAAETLGLPVPPPQLERT